VVAQRKSEWQEAEDPARPQKVTLWAITVPHLGAPGVRPFSKSHQLSLGYELADRPRADADLGHVGSSNDVVAADQQFSESCVHGTKGALVGPFDAQPLSTLWTAAGRCEGVDIGSSSHPRCGCTPSGYSAMVCAVDDRLDR